MKSEFIHWEDGVRWHLVERAHELGSHLSCQEVLALHQQLEDAEAGWRTAVVAAREAEERSRAILRRVRQEEEKIGGSSPSCAPSVTRR